MSDVRIKRPSVNRPETGSARICRCVTPIQQQAIIRASVRYAVTGWLNVQFRGLAKNTAQLVTLFALSNLWMVRRHLLTNAGEVRL